MNEYNNWRNVPIHNYIYVNGVSTHSEVKSSALETTWLVSSHDLLIGDLLGETVWDTAGVLQ